MIGLVIVLLLFILVCALVPAFRGFALIAGILIATLVAFILAPIWVGVILGASIALGAFIGIYFNRPSSGIAVVAEPKLTTEVDPVLQDKIREIVLKGEYSSELQEWVSCCPIPLTGVPVYETLVFASEPKWDGLVWYYLHEGRAIFVQVWEHMNITTSPRTIRPEEV
jgi:energy-coupling factor transporter transmembrane protein EcfT